MMKVMVRNYDFDFDKLLYEKLHTRVVKQEKHDWIQSIQYLLSLNGLGNVWLQPPSCNNSIIKSYGRIFSKRAEDQYIQKCDKNACYLKLHTDYQISTKHTHVQTIY